MIGFTDTLEMLAELTLATLATRTISPRGVLDLTSRLCDALTPSTPRDNPAGLAHTAHTLATRLSRWVPRANCLDEAIATRLWLARRGVPGDVIVGMRRAASTGWDGHAWLVVDGRPFGLGDLHHTVVFRESELSHE